MIQHFCGETCGIIPSYLEYTAARQLGPLGPRPVLLLATNTSLRVIDDLLMTETEHTAYPLHHRAYQSVYDVALSTLDIPLCTHSRVTVERKDEAPNPPLTLAMQESDNPLLRNKELNNRTVYYEEIQTACRFCCTNFEVRVEVDGIHTRLTVDIYHLFVPCIAEIPNDARGIHEGFPP